MTLKLTFNVPLIVVLFDNVVKPDTFNDDINEVLPYKIEIPVTFKPFEFKDEYLVKLFI